MTPITKKLKKYRSINKGVVKAINHLKPGSKLSLAASIPVLVMASYSNISAQCTMQIFASTTVPDDAGAGGGIAFDVNSASGSGNDFSIFDHATLHAVKLKILNASFSVLRVASHTINSASALRITNSTANNSFAGGNFVNIGNNDLYLNYGIGGQFTDGSCGFVIFKNSSGFVGFFQLCYTYMNIGDKHIISSSHGGLNTIAGPIIPGVCPSLTLPIELIDFSAVGKEGQVDLTWLTASETGNAGFEIQRSENGQNFRSIGFVEGKGTTTLSQEYSYPDSEVRMGQLYYYRLRQIDFDGQSDFSEILTVKLQASETEVGETYPNPSKNGAFNVEFITIEDGEWNVNLYNIAGQLVASEQRNISNGASVQSFSFNGLNKGLYFIKFENGVESIYKKVTTTN